DPVATRTTTEMRTPANRYRRPTEIRGAAAGADPAAGSGVAVWLEPAAGARVPGTASAVRRGAALDRDSGMEMAANHVVSSSGSTGNQGDGGVASFVA